MKMDYKDTLNMMKTDFPMRANLPQREPEILKGWYDGELYEKLMEHNEGKPLFILHDGLRMQTAISISVMRSIKRLRILS